MIHQLTQRLAHLATVSALIIFARSLALHHPDAASAQEAGYLAILIAAVLLGLSVSSRTAPAVVVGGTLVGFSLCLPAALGTRGALVGVLLAATAAWCTWRALSDGRRVRFLDLALSPSPGKRSCEVSDFSISNGSRRPWPGSRAGCSACRSPQPEPLPAGSQPRRVHRGHRTGSPARFDPGRRDRAGRVLVVMALVRPRSEELPHGHFGGRRFVHIRDLATPAAAPGLWSWCGAGVEPARILAVAAGGRGPWLGVQSPGDRRSRRRRGNDARLDLARPAPGASGRLDPAPSRRRRPGGGARLRERGRSSTARACGRAPGAGAIDRFVAAEAPGRLEPRSPVWRRDRRGLSLAAAPRTRPAEPHRRDPGSRPGPRGGALGCAPSRFQRSAKSSARKP